MSLGLRQEDVARILKVSTDTITYWENDRYETKVGHMPKIIAFLGYIPMEKDSGTPGGKIKLYRYEHGYTQEQLAKLIGIDPSTLSRIEAGQYVESSKTLQKALVYINDKENQ